MAAMDLGDIAAFVAVVEAGGFTEAARRKHTTKSALSRRVAVLEATLGVPLLERQARGVRTNEVGAVYYAKCVRILEAVDAASDFAAGFGEEMQGRISLLFERDYMRAWMMPALFDFGRQHPNISLHVDVAEAFGSMDGLDVDLRVVSEPMSGKQWIVKPLARASRWLCAAPAYLQRHGVPADIDTLGGHDAVFDAVNDPASEWILAAGDDSRTCRPVERLRSSDTHLLLQAVLEGAGIGLLPASVVAGAIADGRLSRLFPEYVAPDLGLFLVYNSSRRGSRKIQALLSCLEQAAPAHQPPNEQSVTYGVRREAPEMARSPGDG